MKNSTDTIFELEILAQKTRAKIRIKCAKISKKMQQFAKKLQNFAKMGKQKIVQK